MKSLLFPLDTPAPLPHGYYAKAHDGWWVYAGKMPSVELELYYMALVALAPKGEERCESTS